jgi:4'-phosphopantetheinyl transferase
MDCELWYVTTESARDAAHVDVLRARLTEEERARHDAFVFEKNRLEFLLTRALSRWVVARWENKRASDLQFRATKYGQPLIYPASDVRFNLTNTLGLVACIVSRSREVGIDAEPIDEGERIMSVAETVFTHAERDALAQLSETDRRHRAVELWTTKESYMKARGLGMSIEPKTFAVDFTRAPQLDVGAIGDDDARWELTTRDLEGHVVATCVERIAGKKAAIDVRFVECEQLLAI